MGCTALLVIGELNFFFPLEKLKTDFSPFFFLVIVWRLLFIIIQMLLSNRFLTGHDVAQVLVHYEDLVGMAFW
jgi:hypothetical protein